MTEDKAPKRFPSGSCIPIYFPTPGKGKRSRTIWIDGDRLEEARDVIRQYEAGTLSEREAESAIFRLEY